MARVVEEPHWQRLFEAKQIELAKTQAERDEAQRGYLNTKLWWETERANARKHEGTIVGMATQIEELESECARLQKRVEELEGRG
jgi:hypothetical protein